MRFTTDVGFKPHVVAQCIDESRLPIPRVILRIVYADDDFELRRANLADALSRYEFAGMRRARCIKKGRVCWT